MNVICIALACLFAWCVITAGHARYEISPAPAAVVDARP